MRPLPRATISPAFRGNFVTSVRHASTKDPRYNQTMRLPDGRTLGYSENGRATDYPLLFMHGYPTSRLETFGLEDVARRHNLRIICADRNGYGLTTFDPNRKILDWPDDVQALAQHLEFDRFAVLGGSGGGPYALACAHKLPPGMLSSVGIMGGAGPWEGGAHYNTWPYRISALSAQYWPSSYGGLLKLLLWVGNRALRSPAGVERIDKWIKESILTNPKDSVAEIRECLVDQALEAFRQGVQPAVHDARLLTSNWGINFEDVAYDEIKIWHGSKDKNSPVELIRYMAARLPHCTLKEFPEDTHFTLHQHLEEMILELTPTNSRSGGY